ncbi:MAG: AAA family ATPase [Cyanobacteriota bacterium]|nr:AAA family ATPase [Cyanobacteriota bacterium]
MTMSLPGYQIKEQISMGISTKVYRGIRKRDNLPVIVKILSKEYPSIQEISSIRQEYNLTKNIDIPGIVKSYSLERYNLGYALILEDFVGRSLKELLTSEKLDLREKLRIVIALVESLGEMHKIPIVHKDIKPSNIIVNSETGQVKLTDFGIATHLGVSNQAIANPNLLEGTLPYIAPEQTGRMNRSIDYRSDYYSLGATLYEMLTGRLPFLSTDPMELVHCHIAKTPVPPHELETDIGSENTIVPKAISNIVMKLLAKNAEDRYQSAEGLKYDLEKCLNQLIINGKIEEFTLAKHDKGNQLLIPQKLYGREAEVAAIMDGFLRASQGARETILVSGYSGIGKTAIVNEVHKPIVKARGYFISGKFDQFKRDIPFAAIAKAVSELIEQLLTESPDKINLWKEKISWAIGENAWVIIDVIPEVELIIGSQPKVPELGPTESQNRFNRVFKQFMRVFCQPEHPLVMFIDDLQWADSASLKLLELLMTDVEGEYLLIIGAYRDNEVSSTHPLIKAIEKTKESGAVVNNITIAPLQRQQVSQLVAETLGETESPPDSRVRTNKQGGSLKSKTQPLAELAFNKTQGNPFFATQLLKTLYSEKLLVYRAGMGWEWNLQEIQAVGIADYNVVELMARNIKKLPEDTQFVLKLAACVGNQFNLDVLAIALGKPPTIAAAYLWPALEAGSILPRSDAYKIPLAFAEDEAASSRLRDVKVDYKFLHDRVQQAAYSLIPDLEKKETHLKIGQLLLENTTPEEREENIFALVNQLNFGIDLLSTQSEKDELAQLNAIAAKKAKASAAYEAYLNYLKVALKLLGDHSWSSHYEFSLSVYIAAQEAQYLNSNFEEADLLAEVALAEAKSNLEKVKVYEIKLESLIARFQHQKAVELGEEIIEMLGLTLEEEPPKIEMAIEDLADLPEMTYPDKLAAMEILDLIATAAFSVDSEKCIKINNTKLKLSIEYGNSPFSPVAYLDLGFFLCGSIENIERGYRLGKLGIKLLDKFDLKKQKSVILDIFNSHIRHGKEHLRETLEPLLDAFQSGLEFGELIYSGYAILTYGCHLFFLGEELESVERKQREYLEKLQQLKLEYHVAYGAIGRQLSLNLLGRCEDNLKLIGEAFNEAEIIPILIENNVAPCLAYFYTAKTMLCYLFKEPEEAIANAQFFEKYKLGATGFITSSQKNFYYSLALLAACKKVSESDRQEYLKIVESNQETMKILAGHAPMNYEHKYALVEAEKARVLGKKWEAAELYEAAIKGAAKQKYPHEEALAKELAGEFYLSNGQENIGGFYLRESYYGYIRWGANAKVQDVGKRYPQFISKIVERNLQNIAFDATITVPSTTTTSGGWQLLDLPTVIKASQAISSEIILEKLLESLMKIIIENVGARKGILILENSERIGQEKPKEIWEYREDRGLSAMGELTKNDLGDRLPMAAINYVTVTQKDLVLNDATASPKLAADPYIQQYGPKSILCAPLVNRARTIAIIYLENNLVKGAFTRERLALLKLLCSQAAISLQNAKFYQDLQVSNGELQKSLKELKEAQIQLVQSEKMSALGNLVAGIAHEINNPVGFISGNLEPITEYVEELFEAIRLYQRYYPEAIPELEAQIDAMDIDFLEEDLPKLISSMETATDRIADISKSMRTFSRSDAEKKVEFDIHEGIDSTLVIIKHRLKANSTRPEILILKEYADLPKVLCYPGQLNQVFMNLISNAVDALEESNAGLSYRAIEANPNRITLRTRVLLGENAVEIRIADNGPGIAQEVQQRLFEHLFTTKAVGKGTGLGLSIARNIVEEKHGGKLSVVSMPGEGAEFAIVLPIA